VSADAAALRAGRAGRAPRRPDRRAWSVAIAALGFALTAAGCGDPSDHPDVRDGGIDALDAGPVCPVTGQDTSTGMELVLGTGRDATLDGFHPLAPGEMLWVTPGEQGLQHVIVAFRGRGFTPTNPLIEVRLVRASDCNELGYLRFRLPFHPDATDPTLLVLEALRVTLVDDNDRFEYCTALGHDAVLIVNFDDGNGQRAHREARVFIAGIDPSAPPDIRDAWLAPCLARDDGGVLDAR
jgi:hypothetical protein